MKLPEIKEISILIKILKSEYVDDLLNGKLYMNNLKYFVDLEKYKGEQGIGDIREASLLNIKKHELFIQCGDDAPKKIDIGPPPGIIYDEEVLYHPVFCTIGKNIYLNKINCNTYTGTIKLNKENIKDFVGDRTSECKAVVIINRMDFLARIKEKNVLKKADFVNYRDMRLPNIQDGEWLLDNTFTKDVRFENQSEYRVELFLHTKEHYILDIGDIRDIAFVVECENLLSGLLIKEIF